MQVLAVFVDYRKVAEKSRFVVDKYGAGSFCRAARRKGLFVGCFHRFFYTPYFSGDGDSRFSQFIPEGMCEKERGIMDCDIILPVCGAGVDLSLDGDMDSITIVSPGLISLSQYSQISFVNGLPLSKNFISFSKLKNNFDL